MIINFIKIALRDIRRHKLFSFINIFSLMLSITICLSVLLVIKSQLSFDDFHPYPDRTYRIITEVVYDDGSLDRWATIPLALGKMLEENYEFVESYVRLNKIYGYAIANGKKLGFGGSFTGPAFFKIFGFELKYGNPATALSKPYSVVLTQETKQRFFGNKNPIGETFSVEGKGDFTITGVLKPIPYNTHLNFGLLASINTIPLLDQKIQDRKTSWENYELTRTYLLVKQSTKISTLKKNITAVSKNVSGNFELDKGIQKYNFEIQALEDITPGDFIRGPLSGNTRSITDLIFLSVLGLIILLLACFNYTNLSIARALKRAREVGMYKIFGAGRFSIIAQFVTQAVIIVLFSLVLAYALLPFIPLPPEIMREALSVDLNIELIIWLLLFALFVGLLAGGLPAWILSKGKPVELVKNFKNLRLIKGFKFRKFLVVIQFALSLTLIIFTLVIYRQSHFMVTADYGFRTKNIINLQLQGVNREILTNEISQIAGVKQITATAWPFGTFSPGRTNIQKNKTNPPIRVDSYSISPGVIDNFELNLIAGKTFPEKVSTKKEKFIIVNEQMLSLMDWENPSEAVGKTVFIDDSIRVQVAGVIQDFHYSRLRQPIGPLILRNRPDWFNWLNIRTASSKNERIIKEIKSIWSNIDPLQPINYRIYGEYLNQEHFDREGIAAIGFYALIAIAIACLGLLGMVVYTVEVRTKEVGIRKVLGAGVGRIVLLISKEFLWLLLAASVIGIPAGYYMGTQFLSDFAYHISTGIGTLAAGFAILLVAGLLAIGPQTWQIARRNPIDSIRNEV